MPAAALCGDALTLQLLKTPGGGCALATTARARPVGSPKVFGESVSAGVQDRRRWQLGAVPPVRALDHDGRLHVPHDRLPERERTGLVPCHRRVGPAHFVAVAVQFFFFVGTGEVAAQRFETRLKRCVAEPRPRMMVVHGHAVV